MFLADKDKYTFKRYFGEKAHSASLFTVEILPEIFAQFGEPRSKLHSSRYQLIQISFHKHVYTTEMAEAFWKRFSVQYISYECKNRKLPPIYRVIGNPQRLIHRGYIAICGRMSTERETFLSQHSYEYWLNKFDLNSDIYSDSYTQNEAIKSLINKVGVYPTLLKNIPTTDWRVFEELVAEVFSKFGYEIQLTKRTRDGGKDIIALRTDGDRTIERILIECKHWKDKIDVNPVRNLIGVAVTQEELPSGIILATTSGFTPDAKSLKINPEILIQLSLKDHHDVLEWIGKYNAIQLTPEEITIYFRHKSH